MSDLLLADTSAYHRAGNPTVAGRWRDLVERYLLATTAPVRLEVLFSARSPTSWQATKAFLDDLHQLPCGDAAWSRAEQVQGLLAERAMHHRSVKLNDLLIAAAAELSGARVLHYDQDYDRIAAVTGQPTEWIAERGSLP